MTRSEQQTIRSRRVAVAGAVAVALLAACSSEGDGAAGRVVGTQVAAQEAEKDRESAGVTVVGEGRARAVPDTARVLVGVEVTRPDVDAAFGDANDAMGDILDTLRDQGVADEDLRTEELSVRERRDDRPPPRPTDEPQPAPPPDVPDVVGYTVTNLVEVTIRDLDRAGELISAVVDAGGSAVRIQRFSLAVDDDATLLDDARSAAFADAERRAEQYAELAGRDLGDLLAISEVIGSPAPGPMPEFADGAGAAPIEPGQQQAVVRIQTTWALD